MVTEMDQAASPRKSYIAGLDGIRALAIGLVLFSHSVIYDEFTSLHLIGFGAGYAGVAVFFVLSGYLITTLLLREEEQTGGISLRYFYLRRALRLFPALWLYLLVVGAIWLAGWLPQVPWHDFVSSLFYVRNFVGHGRETAHLWSLSLEEQFYFLWPLVMMGLPGRNRVRLGIALIGIVGVTFWRIYAARTGLASAGALYIRSDFRFDAPLFGCALALVMRTCPSAICWVNSTGRRSALLALAGVGGLGAWIGLRIDQAMFPGTDGIVVCLLSSVLVLSQVGSQNSGSGWLAWRPLVLIGQISYGVYLWQQLFLGPQIPAFEAIRTFPIGLAATFVVAAVSYYFLERPLLRLKEMRYYKTRGEEKNASSEALLQTRSSTPARVS
jgi:peptidoglycan/LPS O-acetylase OafA/YrhL